MQAASGAEKRASKGAAGSPRVAEAEGKAGSAATADSSFVGCDYAKLVRSFDREMDDSTRLIEERIQAMRDLYLQAIKDHLALEKTSAKLEARQQESETKHAELQQQAEAHTQKLDKANNMCQTLQSLADELERQRQDLVEQARAKEAEDLARRQQVSDKFLEQIKHVSNKLEEHSAARTAGIDENDSLRNQLKQILERYQSREQEVEHGLQSKTTQLSSYGELHVQIEESIKVEQEKCESYQERIKQLMGSEADLRVQLNVYATKFEQFQDALNTSNDMFSQFRRKLEEMTKTIHRLEKENSDLAERTQKGKETTAEMQLDIDYLRTKMESSQKRNDMLQNLCATLESENEASRAVLAELQPSSLS